MDPATAALIAQAAGGVMQGIGGLFGGGGMELTNPRQLADEQFNRNLLAAIAGSRFTNFNQVSPFGTSVFSGEPGSPGYTQTVTLDPAEQRLLDERRVLAQALTDMATQYMVPQVERGIRAPLDFSALPQLPPPGAAAGAGGMGFSPGLMAGGAPPGPAKPGGAQQPPAPGTPSGGLLPGSYLPATPPESDEMRAYRQAMEQWRADQDAYQQALAARQPVLPTAVPSGVIADYYAETNPDKRRDIPRWMRATGLDPTAATYAIADLAAAARQGFPGASNRSSMILQGLPGFLEVWAQDRGVLPDIGPPPTRPRMPRPEELYP